MGSGEALLAPAFVTFKRLTWLRSLAALLFLAAVVALVATVFWPGHMNLDTLAELQSAQIGWYSDWHSAVWCAIWRLLLMVGLHNPGWMMAGDALMLILGLYLLLRTRLSRPWAALAAAAVFVYPPVLSWDIAIGTDTWFAASILCGFGFAAHSTQTQGRARTASVAIAVGCAALAFAARPTALPACFLLLCAVALTMLPPRLGGWRRVLSAGAAAGAGAGVVAGSILGLQYAVLHAVQTHPEQTTIAYDLIRMSVRGGKLLLPADAYPRQDVGYLARQSTAGDVDALLFGSDPAIAGPFEGARLDALRGAWLTAIRERPDVYLRVRAVSALLQLDITSAPSYAYYGAPPPEYGFELRSPRLHQAAVAYLALGSTPDAIGHPGGRLDPAWMYVLLLAMAVAAGLRLRGPAGAVRVLLGAALLAYTVELLLVSPVVAYRYMYPSVVTGTVLAVTLLAGAGGLLRTRLSSSG